MVATSTIDRRWFLTWTQHLGRRQRILTWLLQQIARKLSFSYGTTLNEWCFLRDTSSRGTGFLTSLNSVLVRCLAKQLWAWHKSAWTTLYIWWGRLFMWICRGGRMPRITPSNYYLRKRQETKYVAQGCSLMISYCSCIIRASWRNASVVLLKRLLTFGRPM